MRRLYLYKKFTEDGVAIRDAAANIARSDDEVFVVTEHDRKHEELDKAIETSRAHDIIIVKTMDNMGQAAEDTLKRLRTIMEKRICFISCDMKMTYEHGVSPDDWKGGKLSSKAFMEWSGMKKATFYNKVTEYSELLEEEVRYRKAIKRAGWNR